MEGRAKRPSEAELGNEPQRRKQEADGDFNIVAFYAKVQILANSDHDEKDANEVKHEEEEEKEEEEEEEEKETEDETEVTEHEVPEFVEGVAQQSVQILLPPWAAEFSKEEQKYVRKWMTLGLLEMQDLKARIEAWQTGWKGCAICMTSQKDDVRAMEEQLRKVHQSLRKARLELGYSTWRAQWLSRRSASKTGTHRDRPATVNVKDEDEEEEKLEEEKRKMLDEEEDENHNHGWQDCPKTDRVEMLRSWIDNLNDQPEDRLRRSTNSRECPECGLPLDICKDETQDLEEPVTEGKEQVTARDTDRSAKICQIGRARILEIAGCVWLWGGFMNWGKEEAIRKWVRKQAFLSDVEEEERQILVLGKSIGKDEKDDQGDNVAEDTWKTTEAKSWSDGEIRGCMQKDSYAWLLRTTLMIRMLAEWG